MSGVVKRMFHFKDPQVEQQMNRLVKAIDEGLLLEQVQAHAEQTGGVHGIPEGGKFESTDGAQQKADTAQTNAETYADGVGSSVLAQAETYADGVKDEVMNVTVRLLSGSTTNRPEGVPVGQPYFDTDLGLPIWWDGSEWVDATGSAV